MNIAYTALHYGSPYLGWAIRSVIDYVDEYYILYSRNGSHGTRAQNELPLSDSRGALMEIAYNAAGDKLRWVDGDWQHEGQQRDSIYSICPEARRILVLDYDEIWPGGLVDYAMTIDNVKHTRFSMVHFWRSFGRCVLHDPAYPIRLIVPNGEGEQAIQLSPIAHMGYAIPDWLLRYKMSIHGHRAELRTDDWYNKKWRVNAQTDCHPVGSDHWNPEAVNPLDYLPDWMQDHPYYSKEIIR